MDQTIYLADNKALKEQFRETEFALDDLDNNMKQVENFMEKY